MKLKGNNWEIEFNFKERYSESADMWSGDITFNQSTFTVSFFEYKGKYFDRDGLVIVLNNIFGNFDKLLETSKDLSIALNKSIFKNQYDKFKSHFDLSSIDILGYGNVGNFTHIKWAHFNFDLHLIDETAFLSDPYVTYETLFELDGKYINTRGITRV